MTPRTGFGFALLCLLSGSAWIADEYRPSPLTGLTRPAVHYAALAVLFALFSVIFRRASTTIRLRSSIELAACAIFLFAVPPILIAGAAGTVSGLTETLVCMLVPVVVVFLTAQQDDRSAAFENPLRSLLPALVALGGAGLLIPYTLPVSLAGRFWLTAMVVSAILAAVAAIRLHRLLAQATFLTSTAMLAASVSLFTVAFLWITPTGGPHLTFPQATVELLHLLLLDAPILLLTVWLLRAVTPSAFSARYFIIPLVTIAEALVLLRPQLSWTIVVGAVLMAGGALTLLRADSRQML